MEIKDLISKMKDIHSAVIDYIDATDDSDAELKALFDIFDNQEILQKQEEIQLLFQLISKISDNHHQTSDFFGKLEKIFQYLINDIPSPISNYIPDYLNYNKRLLYFLLEKGFIKPDELFLNKYKLSKTNSNQFYYYYLYPKIKEFLDKKLQKQIEEEITQRYEEDISTFEKKCQIGENDSYICSLIRSDSVEEFIAHVNRNKLSLLAKIKPSVYETHSFLIDKEPTLIDKEPALIDKELTLIDKEQTLIDKEPALIDKEPALIDKEPTLIEYSAFFGSIQIIRYLKYNKVPLTSSLWLYAIHSNNPELIHFLEENKVKPEKNEKDLNSFDYYKSGIKKKLYDDVLIESIKCHHNAITNYIKDNFYEQIQSDDENHFYDNFSNAVVDSLNFFFFPNEIESIICKQKNNNGFKLSQLCFSLTQITIPSSVISIGNSAFSGCSLLTQITISSFVISIGNNAFEGCSSLTQIVIPSSVSSFGNCIFKGIKILEIKGNIQYIPNYLFLKCSSLKQITIPSSVTEIGNNAFEGCSSLTQITIPSSVTSIGNNAFSKCSSLEQITIPSSITEIGEAAFNECSSLTQITIPSFITSIKNNTFNGCSSLIKIEIPSSVISIGNFAFNRCSSLTKITIPSSATEIGEAAFSRCSSLTQIAIPSFIASIKNNTFNGCSSLIQIEIPSSVTSIRNYAFYGCSSLTQITIPSSVKLFGKDIFDGIKTLEIKGNIQHIPNYFFSYCSSLTQITFPSTVSEIVDSAFRRCSSLTQITIPSSVASIGNYAFQACSSLKQITIYGDIYLEEYSFIEELKYIIKNLDDTTVYVADLPINNAYPPSCTVDENFITNFLHDHDFYPVSVIIKAIIGKNSNPCAFASIKFKTHDEALSAVNDLNYTKINDVPIRFIIKDKESKNNICNYNKSCIIIKNLDREIEVSQIHDAFEQLGEIISCKMPISFDNEKNKYLSYGYCFVCFHNTEDAEKAMIFFKDKLINGNPIEIEPISILIKEENFYSSKQTANSSVKKIGVSAFSECSSLTQITIPSSITSIGENAFYGCSSLTQMTIPSSVTEIGNDAFYGCSKLTQITILSSVTESG